MAVSDSIVYGVWSHAIKAHPEKLDPFGEQVLRIAEVEGKL